MRPPGPSSRRATAGAYLAAGLLSWLAGSPTGALAKGPPPPLVGHVQPDRGPAAGGTPVTIVGSNFRPGARVTFDNVDASAVVVVDDRHITAVAPPHRPGSVDVSVRNVDWLAGGRGCAFAYQGEARARAPAPAD